MSLNFIYPIPVKLRTYLKIQLQHLVSRQKYSMWAIREQQKLGEEKWGQIKRRIYPCSIFCKSRVKFIYTFFQLYVSLITGDGTDYLNVAIKDGSLSLTMGLANGKQEMQIKPNKVRFDDNQWHKVSVHRRIQEVSKI